MTNPQTNVSLLSQTGFNPNTGDRSNYGGRLLEGLKFNDTEIPGGRTQMGVNNTTYAGEIGSTNTNADNMTSAEGQMVGNAVGSVLSAGSRVAGGIMNMQENERAKQEARGIASQNREDTLKQRDVEFSLNKRKIEREEKIMRLNQQKSKFDLRFSRWKTKMEKSIEGRKNLSAIGAQFRDAMANEDFKNALASHYGSGRK